MYHINPFVYSFKRDHIVALFNALSLSTLYLTETEYHNLINSPSDDLVEREFWVKENFDAVDYLKKHANRIKIPLKINVAYFLVTSACNFNCEYCFIETRFENQKNIYMTKDIAERGVNLLYKNTDQNVTVYFYGGEPLLNFEIIQHIVETAQKIGLHAEYAMITNGSIINDDISSFIKKHNISISISLDGDRDTHDKGRKDIHNQGTYDKITNTIETLLYHGIKCGLSCTITPYNMDNPQEILDVMKKYNLKGLGYNLMTNNGNLTVDNGAKRLMVKNILASEERIFKDRLIEDTIINKKVKPFFEGKNWIRNCAAYGQQIVITPKGEVGICHGLWPDFINKEVKTYFDLDVNYEGKITEHPSWLEWFNRIPFNMPQCWNCFCIGLCGGGCAKNSLINKGSIWEIDDDICILAKETIPWIIWKYYDECVKCHEE